MHFQARIFLFMVIMAGAASLARGETTCVRVQDGAAVECTTLSDQGKTMTNRIIVAVVPRQGFTWFFKLQGDAPIVVREKSAFVDFLKSVDFRAADSFMQAAMSGQTPSGRSSR